MSQSTSLGEGPRSPLRELAEQIRFLWWIPLITGLVSIGLGLAILATDWTVHALVIITGLAFIIRGIALAFSPAYAGRTSGEQVVAGIAGVIAGVVLVAWPGPSLLVLAFFVGAWLAVSGSFHIVTSVSRRRELPHWVFTLALGVIELLLGIWAMRRPEATLALLITIIGLWAVVTGVIYCVLAFEIRSTARALATGKDVTGCDAAQLADRLGRLAQLHAEGMLSTEEYAQLKSSLLAAHTSAHAGHEPWGAASSDP
ncbi:MAG TPA: DUF308 domain-containing protein [Streptosporangiaceae bacterium]|nr:DUF308 domain-containing protein [Streptosporangiaceae bacterium]